MGVGLWLMEPFWCEYLVLDDGVVCCDQDLGEICRSLKCKLWIVRF